MLVCLISFRPLRLTQIQQWLPLDGIRAVSFHNPPWKLSPFGLTLKSRHTKYFCQFCLHVPNTCDLAGLGNDKIKCMAAAVHICCKWGYIYHLASTRFSGDKRCPSRTVTLSRSCPFSASLCVSHCRYVMV